MEGQLPLTYRMQIVVQLLPESSEPQKRELATEVMDDCLRAHFGGDEPAILLNLLEILGSTLDCRMAVSTGLDSSVPPSVVNRNIIVFNKSPKRTRKCILTAIEELAAALATRSPLDIDENAATACADLLLDAQSDNFDSLLRGAARLLPTLFRSGHAPVSAIIAVTFPLVYRELAKADDVPSIFKIVPFFDWDRCKAARRELVDAFLWSETWRPSDLALTACRASDISKILWKVAKSHHGKAYIQRVAEGLEVLPVPCRERVEQVIKQIQSD